MNKKQLLMALTSIVCGLIISRYIKAKTTLTIPEIPPLTLDPELQKWADYVTKYPNLEDDPNMKWALGVLKQYDDPK